MSGKPLALCGDSRELGVLEGRSENFYDIPFPHLLVSLCSNILYFPSKNESILPYLLGWEGMDSCALGRAQRRFVQFHYAGALGLGGWYEKKFNWSWLYNACSLSEVGLPCPEMEPSNACRNAGSLPSCLPTKLHSSRGDSFFFFFLFFPPSWHKSGKWVLIVLNWNWTKKVCWWFCVN